MGHTGPVVPLMVVPPCANIGTKLMNVAGKFRVGCEAASSAVTWPAPSVTSSAARFCSSWSIRRAPMMVEATPGLDCTQASATAAGVVPSSPAMRMSSSMIVRLRSVRKFVTRSPRSAFAVAALARVYLPDSTPPRSGDHGVTPRPMSIAIGINSPSTVRSINEYSIWRAMSGAHPRKSACVCACATFQAGVSEKPT